MSTDTQSSFREPTGDTPSPGTPEATGKTDHAFKTNTTESGISRRGFLGGLVGFGALAFGGVKLVDVLRSPNTTDTGAVPGGKGKIGADLSQSEGEIGADGPKRPQDSVTPETEADGNYESVKVARGITSEVISKMTPEERRDAFRLPKDVLNRPEEYVALRAALIEAAYNAPFGFEVIEDYKETHPGTNYADFRKWGIKLYQELFMHIDGVKPAPNKFMEDFLARGSAWYAFKKQAKGLDANPVLREENAELIRIANETPDYRVTVAIKIIKDAPKDASDHNAYNLTVAYTHGDNLDTVHVAPDAPQSRLTTFMQEYDRNTYINGSAAPLHVIDIPQS